MRGSVRKHGKTWEIVYDIGKGADGKRRMRTRSGFPTKRAGEKELRRVLNERDAGRNVEPSKLTVGAFFATWIEGRKSGRNPLKQSTWDSYDRNIRAHIIPALGTLPMQKLCAEDLDAFYADRVAGRTRAAISPRTACYIHMIIRRALSDAVKRKVVEWNVADHAEPPRMKVQTEMRTWSRDELRAFLAHVGDDRLYAAWLLAASTGMRRGEVLGLRWRDLDLDAGRASVVQTLISVKFKLVTDTPKTKAGTRNVALDTATVAALREHKRKQSEEVMAFGRADWPEHDLVFTREEGSPVHPDAFSRWFDQHVKAARLPDIRLHDLRHTHATIALQAGIHPLVVSKRLGHSKVEITLNTYSHVIPALHEEAAEKVAAFMWGS